MSDVDMELSMGSTEGEEAPPNDPFAFAEGEPVSPVSKGIAEMSELFKNCTPDENGLALPLSLIHI